MEVRKSWEKVESFGISCSRGGSDRGSGGGGSSSSSRGSIRSGSTRMRCGGMYLQLAACALPHLCGEGSLLEKPPSSFVGRPMFFFPLRLCLDCICSRKVCCEVGTTIPA